MSKKGEQRKLKKWRKLSKEVKGFILMRQWVREELADIRGCELKKTEKILISNYQHLTNIIGSYGVHDIHLPDYVLDMNRHVLEIQLNTYGIDPENFL